MSITSLSFLLFITFIFVIYFILPQKTKPIFLVLASLLFYFFWAAWAPIFMLLYAACVYFAAILVRNQKNHKLIVLISCIGVIIAVFLFIRYTSTSTKAINEIALIFGINISFVFPLGFSYYMFKSISYLIDVYFGKLEIEKRYDHLLLHLCFFPEISMGPVTRASDFLPQIKTPKRLDVEVVYRSCVLILWGLFKKMVLADRLALTVNQQIADASITNGFTFFVIAFSYLIELYLDFSAYTDISVAISGILGYSIKHNFNAPFFSQTISEYWRSWHTSLSSWLSDYIFTPLQFLLRKYGIYASVLAALITLTISGLWHDISIRYIVFGFSMGVFISIDALFAKKRKVLKKRLPHFFYIVASIMLTMLINVILINFVRSADASKALVIVGYILNPTTWSLHTGLGGKFFVTLAVAIVITVCSHFIELKRTQFFGKLFALPKVVRLAGYYALIFAIILLGSYAQSSFMYFHF